MTFVVAWVSGPKQITYRDKNDREFTKKDGSRAWRNNNPGNIIKGDFANAHGAIGHDSKFAVFPDETAGREAVIALFQTANYANLSIRNAFFRYAPPSDGNKTEQYIAGVAQSMGVSANTIVNTLSHAQLERLADAIKQQEGWNPGTTSGRDAAAPAAAPATASVFSAAPAAPATPAAAAAPSGDAAAIADLVAIGADPARCAQIVDQAATYMIRIYGHKTLHNACAVTLSLFLRVAGIDVDMEPGAGALAKQLRDKRGWTRVNVGDQQAGDVAVCFDRGPPAGADHIFFVVRRVDADEMLIADNQGASSPHQRFATGRGKTAVDYFLRAPAAAVTSTAPDDRSIVELDEPTDQLVLRFTASGARL